MTRRRPPDGVLVYEPQQKVETGGMAEELRRQIRLSSMMQCALNNVKTVLCLGAHSDDIEIGCGGTLMKLAREHKGLTVFWVVFTADGQRQAEARASARVFLSQSRESEGHHQTISQRLFSVSKASGSRNSLRNSRGGCART